MLFADEAFLGNNLLVWLVLALGAAMVVGNGAALLRPPPRAKGQSVPEGSRRRSLTYVAIGSVVGLWALATLLVR